MGKWERVTEKIDYKENEWIMLYSHDGEKRYKLFDTFEEAEECFNANPYLCKIGIMTTSFYNNVVCR